MFVSATPSAAYRWAQPLPWSPQPAGGLARARSPRADLTERDPARRIRRHDPEEDR